MFNIFLKSCIFYDTYIHILRYIYNVQNIYTKQYIIYTVYCITLYPYYYIIYKNIYCYIPGMYPSLVKFNNSSLYTFIFKLKAYIEVYVKLFIYFLVHMYYIVNTKYDLLYIVTL